MKSGKNENRTLVTEKRKVLEVVVLYSAGHLGSTLILNRLLKMPEYRVVGVVKTQALPFSRAGAVKLKKHLEKIGWRFAWLLFWQRLVQGFFYLLTFSLIRSKRRVQPAWKLALENDIPVLRCRSINNEKAICFIKGLSPDLILSAYFPQILKKPVICLPKLGVLNVHPGWLPAYKGAMTYLWVLRHGREKAGVTLHWIDEGIDTGEIIARQSFKLIPGMTQQNVLVETAVVGAELLKKVGEKLGQGDAIGSIIPDETEEDQYYPMPGEDEFQAYFSRRRFFRIRDLFASIRKGKNK
jgi:folate-dependent phosphoribosylglycinamide formyltransferase PurN